ncbi:MAG: hypothetical protein AB7W16_06975 [Candidatus Obscuribacterales bacterium]
MSDTPRLIGIVLCERVLQDVLRRDAVSCINIYNGITAQSFPAVVPLVYAFAQVSTTTQGFEYQFKIADNTGKVVAMSPTARVEPLPNQYLTHKIISAFSGLTFDREGAYEIILEVAGQSIGSLPFQVVLLQQQQEAPVGQ